MTSPRGFTLIETLIAISVLTIAIVGPYAIANNAIKASRVSQNELTASFLAQEALEYVREIRDASLGARIFGTGSGERAFDRLVGCMGSYCVIDSAVEEVRVCPAEPGYVACPNLYLSNQGIYNQQYEGEETIFTRTVLLTLGHYYADQVRVTATVSWNERGTPYSYTVEETLYDWLGYGN